MGGQACVLYGAAEFSRDVDFAVFAEPGNLAVLSAALADLKAERIFVPPFEAGYLARGHAVHFRCRHPEAAGLRVDIMATMRGVEAFAALWERRTTFTDDAVGESFDALSLPDLVQAKKTQRDKDWPMIQRLLEAHYFQHQAAPTAAQITFWLRELRTVELLLEAARRFPDALAPAAARPDVLAAAAAGDVERTEAALAAEQARERALDRAYWLPLKRELEELRRRRA